MTASDDGRAESILEEALRLVHGDRQEDYDTPTANFTRAGTLWGVVLSKWRDDPTARDVPPELVALCLACLKISREVGKSKRDNRVDLAGYAECLDMIVRDREAKRIVFTDVGLA